MPRVGRDAGVGRDADDHMMLMLMLMFMLLFMLLSIEKKIMPWKVKPATSQGSRVKTNCAAASRVFA